MLIFLKNNKLRAETPGLSFIWRNYYFLGTIHLYMVSASETFSALFKIQRPTIRPVGNSVHCVTRECRAAAEFPSQINPRVDSFGR
jgi:hypothetical protein